MNKLTIFKIILGLSFVGIILYLVFKKDPGGGGSYENCPGRKEKICNGISTCHSCANDYDCDKGRCKCEKDEKYGAIDINEQGEWDGKGKCCNNINKPKNGSEKLPEGGVCCNKNMLLDNGYCCGTGLTRDSSGSKCVNMCGESGFICDTDTEICSSIIVNEKDYTKIKDQIKSGKYSPEEYPAGKESVLMHFCIPTSTKSCIGETSTVPFNFTSSYGYSSMPSGFISSDGEYSEWDGLLATEEFMKPKKLVEYNGDTSIQDSLYNWKKSPNQSKVAGSYRGTCCIGDSCDQMEHLNVIPYKKGNNCSMTKDQAGLYCVSSGIDSPDYADVSERWWAENKGDGDVLGWCILQRKIDSDNVLKCNDVSKTENEIVDNTNEIFVDTADKCELGMEVNNEQICTVDSDCTSGIFTKCSTGRDAFGGRCSAPSPIGLTCGIGNNTLYPDQRAEMGFMCTGKKLGDVCSGNVNDGVITTINGKCSNNCNDKSKLECWPEKVCKQDKNTRIDNLVGICSNTTESAKRCFS
jgi:hypothetical protein